MTPFRYFRARDFVVATTVGKEEGAAYLGGGTNLVDLMKAGVTRPATVVDINGLHLGAIEERPDGGLRLGALVTNSATADHPVVRARYPLLADAILAGASAQLRNAATNGGNLNQRTRCYYFYDRSAVCGKREPGGGCDAIGGVTRVHAILGASAACLATHPSDMCVGLAALGATVQVTGTDGERSIPFDQYHRLPGDEPWRDTTLAPGELVTAIDLPAQGFADHYTYLKLRDRQSYAFALVSVAAALSLQDGVVAEARIALGGVAHKPWRVPAAEAILRGRTPDETLFAAAADRLIEGAVGQGGNDVKIPLARRAIIRALGQAAAGTPQRPADKRIA